MKDTLLQYSLSLKQLKIQGIPFVIVKSMPDGQQNCC
jgi:hypothetical protein